MKRFTLCIAFAFMSLIVIHAKSYPFDRAHSYEVQIVRVAQQSS